MILNNNLYSIIESDASRRTFKVGLIPDCAIYKAHFPELPVTPGVCIIQIATELAQELFEISLRLVSVQNAKFLNIIHPIETPEINYIFRKVMENDEDDTVKVMTEVADNEGMIYAKLTLVYRKK